MYTDAKKSENKTHTRTHTKKRHKGRETSSKEGKVANNWGGKIKIQSRGYGRRHKTETGEK